MTLRVMPSKTLEFWRKPLGATARELLWYDLLSKTWVKTKVKWSDWEDWHDWNAQWSDVDSQIQKVMKTTEFLPPLGMSVTKLCLVGRPKLMSHLEVSPFKLPSLLAFDASLDISHRDEDLCLGSKTPLSSSLPLRFYSIHLLVVIDGDFGQQANAKGHFVIPDISIYCPKSHLAGLADWKPPQNWPDGVYAL